MSGFCIMKFVDNYDYLLNKSFVLKNTKLRDVYIKKFNPFIIEDLIYGNLEEYKGAIVSLPITFEDAVKDNDFLYLLIDKTTKFLISQNYNLVLNDKVFLKSENITYLDKLDINLFFIKDILNKVIKYNNFSRKHISVGVLIGDYEKTIITLNEIYDDLNFLSIIDFQGRFNNYEKITDMIFCDSGLEISYSKNCNDYEILINLDENLTGLFKTIKKTAVVIDLVNTVNDNIISTKIIKHFNFKLNKNYLKDFELELILFSNFLNFRNYKKYNNKLDRFNSAKKEILNNGVQFNNYLVDKKM